MADLTHAERQDIHHALESHGRFLRVVLRSLRKLSPQERDEESMATICKTLLDCELSLQFNAAAAKAPFAENKNLANKNAPELTLAERLDIQRYVEIQRERLQEEQRSLKEDAQDWKSTLSSSQPKAPYFLMPATAKDILHYDQLLQANAKAIEKLKLQARPTLPRLRGH